MIHRLPFELPYRSFATSHSSRYVCGEGSRHEVTKTQRFTKPFFVRLRDFVPLWQEQGDTSTRSSPKTRILTTPF